MAEIIFNSTVNGGITDLDVKINDKLIPTDNSDGVYSIKYTINNCVIKIVYELTGMNGTDYTIDYTCLCDNVNKIDTTKRSPVSGTITSGNYKTETIIIRCNP
jgi:hypothetical protein